MCACARVCLCTRAFPDDYVHERKCLYAYIVFIYVAKQPFTANYNSYAWTIQCRCQGQRRSQGYSGANTPRADPAQKYPKISRHPAPQQSGRQRRTLLAGLISSSTRTGVLQKDLVSYFKHPMAERKTMAHKRGLIYVTPPGESCAAEIGECKDAVLTPSRGEYVCLLHLISSISSPIFLIVFVSRFHFFFFICRI